MRLLELKIHREGNNGWESSRLVFGEKITQLYGPNGSGKTPVMQSIVYALGFPIKFRDDITAHCSLVELKVLFANMTYTIKRNIGTDFDTTVLIGDREEKNFHNEKEYSAYLMGLLGFDFPTLLTTGNKPTVPYMATLLPLVYLDQDDGYSSIYKSPSTFIKDQFSEMMRIAFGLPAKNAFSRKKDAVRAKEKLDALDIKVVNNRKILDEIRSSISSDRGMNELENELAILKGEVNELKKNKADKSSSIHSVDVLIYDKRNEHRAIVAKIHELKTRIDGIYSIKSEIETEINTLSLNEEAKRLFHSFDEICSSSKCGLFFGSSESYGKNLLYLRDQIKDLERNSEIAKVRISGLEENRISCERDVQTLSGQKGKIEEESEVAGLVEAVGELASRIFELEFERKTLEKLEENENNFVSLLNERETALNNYNELSSNRNETSLESAKIRNLLRNRVVYWLNVLRTNNVDRDVSITSDFNFTFGSEKINQIKGSTRVRVVLSIHAAILEMILENDKSNLHFYMLDTPKQHEMHNIDLSDYIDGLELLAKNKGAQIVFSTTEYHYKCGENDVEWVPEYEGEDHNMFLNTKLSNKSI